MICYAAYEAKLANIKEHHMANDLDSGEKLLLIINLVRAFLHGRAD
jgi:hypothetical protein